MGCVPASPYVIRLGGAGRAELETLSRRATAPFRLVMRARIVLLAADGAANCAIAERLGICQDTARKWRRRYCEHGIEGLADAPRPGRPRVFPATVVAGVKALACEMPASGGTPLARWTCPELACHAAEGGIAPAPSASTVRRWLADDALKPWQHRSWIFPRDPHFALKASRALTSASGHGTGSRSARTTTCSAPTRSPASRPACASTSRSRRARDGRCAPKASTTASAPSPTSPPTTSTAPASPAGAPPQDHCVR